MRRHTSGVQNEQPAIPLSHLRVEARENNDTLFSRERKSYKRHCDISEGSDIPFSFSTRTMIDDQARIVRQDKRGRTVCTQYRSIPSHHDGRLANKRVCPSKKRQTTPRCSNSPGFLPDGHACDTRNPRHATSTASW